jgi:hypothetical protein
VNIVIEMEDGLFPSTVKYKQTFVRSVRSLSIPSFFICFTYYSSIHILNCFHTSYSVYLEGKIILFSVIEQI